MQALDAMPADRPVHSDSDIAKLASVPWLAIAAAVHTIVVVIAWFIVPHMAATAPPTVIRSNVDVQNTPPVPEQPAERDNEFLATDTIVDKPAEDLRIAPDPRDDFNSDDVQKPFNELAPADSTDISAQSPGPEKGLNSSVGLGAGFGGGPGGGERGGMLHARSVGPGRGKPRKVPPAVVPAARKWLADHQNKEGYWSATTFNDDSTRKGARRTYNREFVRPGEPQGDKGWDESVNIGLTGLAMLAFTGELHTHKDGDHKLTMRSAVIWLRSLQDNEGCFGPRDEDHFVYNHAIATMAMAEVYLISEDRALRPVVEQAARFILHCQNPGSGWRYGVKPGFSDTSVTGWMVLTLHTVQVAGLKAETDQCYSDAAGWFTAMTTETNGYPRTGYVEPGGNCSRLRSAQMYENLPSMDAIRIMSMLFMRKADIDDATVRAQAAAISQSLPEWKHEKLDFYYWYYASLALFQAGGNAWDKWERPLAKTLLDSQRGFGKEKHETAETLDEHGSWDPVDAWGAAGGRVYSTAINCLTLQVWYRYEKMQQKR